MKKKTRKRKGRKRPKPRKAKNGLTARDIMNAAVLTVRADMTVQELSTFLTENEISGAPVVDEMGKLVGVVSLTDVARSTSEAAGIVMDRSNPDFYVRGWEDKLNPDDLRQMHLESEGQSVRDIMTPTVYSTREETPVSKVAEAMLSSRIHRLLVTRGKRVVGIVTTLDMLKLLVDAD